MTRRTVTVAEQSVWIADDDPPLPELGWWAVLRTRVVDEITEQPPHVPPRISSATPRLLPRVSDDGVCGLVARPRDASTALVTPGGLSATIRVDGYLPQVLDPAIDAARRVLPGGAGAGSTLLTIAPAETADRPQFRPGRGVMVERNAPAEPEQFTLHADPPAPPALNQVPLEDSVQPGRAVNARVAGVPVVLADQHLHRAEPVHIRGRALRQPAPASAPIPAPGARVGMRGLWWTQREVVANSVPPHPARLVASAAPLAFAHDAGVPVDRVTLVPDGTPRACRARAFADGSELAVHPWTALNPAGGDVLQIEAANSSERELVITAGFDAALEATMPARVRLATPLAFAHAPAAPIERMAVIQAPLGALEREAVAGDRVLFLTAMAGLATDDVVRIGGATPTAELRFVRCMPAHDGVAFTHLLPIAADGSFELPPIARVAQIQFFIEHAGHPPQLPFEFVPDHDGDNALRVLFTP
jgi:hypothetical protein